MNLENYNNISTVLKYLINHLSIVDKAINARVDFLSIIHSKKELSLSIFKAKHKIFTKDELDEWITDATHYIFNIKKDILSKITEMSRDDLAQLMNNEEVTDRFLEKYKTKEEDLKNDRFFQCG